MLFFNWNKPKETEIDKIRDFTIVTLKIIGMRSTCEYEMTNDGKTASVSLYHEICVPHGWQRQLQKRTECSIEKALLLLNDCKLHKWDGFHGKHPKNVHDGIMFTLEATLNGCIRIQADGSENFPKHFSDFRNGLTNLLNG